MNDEEKKKRLLNIAKSELKQFKVKYSTLKELSSVMKAIDDVITEGES